MARKGVLIGLLVAVLASTAWGFEPYFADAAGNKLGWVWEGQQVYIAIKDPEKGACGIDEFPADIVVFDFKTGAYLGTGAGVPLTNVVFRELGGIGSGLYFWVARRGSSTKVTVQIGSRNNYATITGQTHVLGVVSPSSISDWADTVLLAVGWKEGAWEYVDENVLSATLPPAGPTTPVITGVANLPQHRDTARITFQGFIPTFGNATPAFTTGIEGRFENMDTLILIAADDQDERNIDQDQVKIADTVAKLTVPSRTEYGCGPACENLIVKVEDKDENLNCNEIEYVPVFVIINPGSWDSAVAPTVNSFCSLLLRGGYINAAAPPWPLAWDEPIRWYNIYSDNRYMNYNGAEWWPAPITDMVIRVVMFVPETAVDSGVFELNLGNLEDFQEFLWEAAAARNHRLPMGTTVAFYYIDPNDFDDMTLGTMEIGNRPHSQTFITDANGIPASEVRIGTGWGGLYVRVYDADADVEACCQDKVVVHICDPHNEDDSEYYVIDEISNNSGIFFTQNGIPLLPVWDAVAGYQLVFDDWRVQAFNEDTVFVRYNSVDYEQAALNALGDANPNDGWFPPAIADGQLYQSYDLLPPPATSPGWNTVTTTLAARNQYWDVSFAKVKVYDTQVFDGTAHHMRFLDGQYRPVTQIPISGSLYLEVTDLDQNEHPMLRELVFGGWNKDADATHEGSNPIWTQTEDLLTPGTVTTLSSTSISGIGATVKVFMWNAQRGA